VDARLEDRGLEISLVVDVPDGITEFDFRGGGEERDGLDVVGDEESVFRMPATPVGIESSGFGARGLVEPTGGLHQPVRDLSCASVEASHRAGRLTDFVAHHGHEELFITFKKLIHSIKINVLTNWYEFIGAGCGEVERIRKRRETSDGIDLVHEDLVLSTEEAQKTTTDEVFPVVRDSRVMSLVASGLDPIACNKRSPVQYLTIGQAVRCEVDGGKPVSTRSTTPDVEIILLDRGTRSKIKNKAKPEHTLGKILQIVFFKNP
jgi:hypothetical protein